MARAMGREAEKSPVLRDGGFIGREEVWAHLVSPDRDIVYGHAQPVRGKGPEMRCKIGDLAIVIGPKLEENLGIFVEVCAVWPDEPRSWWVRSLSGPRLRKDGTLGSEGAVSDNALWPLRGRKPGERDESELKCPSVLIEELR